MANEEFGPAPPPRYGDRTSLLEYRVAQVEQQLDRRLTSLDDKLDRRFSSCDDKLRRGEERLAGVEGGQKDIEPRLARIERFLLGALVIIATSFLGGLLALLNLPRGP